MIISKLKLSNYRNFKDKIIKLSPKINVIVGPNASGKTNILESIFLLSTGKSFRAKVTEEMISYREELARAGGVVVAKQGSEPCKMKLEVVLTRGEITVGENPEKTSKVAKKRLLINGVGKRLIDFAGNLRVVLFGPWDLELVTQEPSKRRKFLDTVLSQVDREYRRASLSYEKGLRQRNRLLWRIREEGVSRAQLLFWNKLLIKNGDYINQRRREFIEFANAGSFQFPISNFQLEYDPSAISEARLEQYKNEEVAAASTLVGPHRDDMNFKISSASRTGRTSRTGKASTASSASRKSRTSRAGGRKGIKSIKRRDLAPFGSRGEQRMGVLWLKLAELSFIEEETEEKPVLLLDDIFSELDHEHREIVINTVNGQQNGLHGSFGGQAIITTADPHFVEDFNINSLIKL